MPYKFSRGFSEATLQLLLTQAMPLADMLTGGKVSTVGDALAMRAALMKTAFKEMSDLMGAVEKALTDGATPEEVEALVKEAAEAKDAIKALKALGGGTAAGKS